jgi:hypothetical protein
MTGPKSTVRFSSRWQKERKRQAIYTQVLSIRYCYGGKSINITYSDSVSVVLVILQATLMHRIKLSSVVCSAVKDLRTLSYIQQNFRESY